MLRITRRTPAVIGLAVVLSLLASANGRTAAQSVETTLEGTIYNAEDQPVPECRVVARVVDDSRVFISPPSDNQGRYALVVPAGRQYVIVALVAPTGGRVALPEPEPLTAVPGSVVQDLRIPLPVAPRPRGAKGATDKDRFFLAFVEDPALAGRQYWEIQVGGTADMHAPDRWDARLIAAFQFSGLPRVEVGLRGGYAELRSGAADGQSGAIDLELWGKFHLLRSANNRWDLAVGSLATLPTGDEQFGLGQDATQSKLFLSASYTLPSALLIAHAGARTTEDGQVGGSRLDGKISPSVGFGVFLPLSARASLVFEANYDGERFEGTESDSRVLAGLNLKTGLRGRLRAALAAGLADAAPDTDVRLGYAIAF